MGLAHFGLGENAVENARQELTGYCGLLGEELADSIANSAATDAEAVKGVRRRLRGGVGCSEPILFPTGSDPAQVDLLAAAAGHQADADGPSRRGPLDQRSARAGRRPLSAVRSCAAGWRRCRRA
jgi:hypothetical protein